ncbi:TIGR04438 family Trp-rich protein [Ottowia sp.]|uniref:TIGR04438 family Trp-rich protein n=1 Tax=Ottowia sp. TaxID=1898956 RepID=UPI003A8935D5
MYLLGLGIILLLLKWQQIGPVADWSWWWVLAPFAGAILWWAWADWSGYTKRKAMERDDVRKLERVNRHLEAIGAKPKTSLSANRRRR